MFPVVATINMVLLTLLAVLVIQIRGFVREAEERSSAQREKILHPLLDFEQIRSIPSLRDIELLLLGVVCLLALYFISIINVDGENLAETFVHWWVAFEVSGILIFCHAILRYSRHLVDRDNTAWHRVYQQTKDFRLFRYASAVVVSGVALYMFFGLPSLSFFSPGERPLDRASFSSSLDDRLSESRTGRETFDDKEALAPFRKPLFVLKTWALLAILYVLNWVLRLRGELVTLMKTIGILLAASAVIGWWTITFQFDPNPANWAKSQSWAFSQWFHLCYTGVFLSLILLLFKDNMVLLGATHRAAQIIAEEKKVMVDFLVRVAEETTHLAVDRSNPGVRRNLDHILRLTLDFSMRESSAKAGAVYLLDSVLKSPFNNSPGRVLVPRVVEGLFPPLQPLSIEYQATRIKYINEVFLTETVDLDKYPFFRDLIEKGDLLYLPDTSGHDEIPQQPTDFLKIHSLIAVPLRVQDQVLGLLMVINKLSDKERGWDEFTPQDASVLNAVADQAAIAIANTRMHEVVDEQERLEREMEIARRVQESLLPASCPEIPGFNIQAFGKAARQIGGDYYDFLKMGDDRFVAVVADVAGKGIPGALTMAALRSALRALIDENESARDLALTLNEFMFDDLKRDVFISVTLAVFDLQKREVSLVRAGHEPILYVRAESLAVEQVVPSGMALGLDRGSLFGQSLEEFKCPFRPGDLILLYTDGVTEAMNEDWEEFSLERLIRLLEETRALGLNEFMSRLRNDLEVFTGDSLPHDDMTVVGIQVEKDGSGDSA